VREGTRQCKEAPFHVVFASRARVEQGNLRGEKHLGEKGVPAEAVTASPALQHIPQGEALLRGRANCKASRKVEESPLLNPGTLTDNKKRSRARRSIANFRGAQGRRGE